MDTQGEAKLEYEPGDHVSIFPSNDVRLVEKLLKRLHNAPDPDKSINVQMYTVESGKILPNSQLKLNAKKHWLGFFLWIIAAWMNYLFKHDIGVSRSQIGKNWCASTAT